MQKLAIVVQKYFISYTVSVYKWTECYMNNKILILAALLLAGCQHHNPRVLTKDVTVSDKKPPQSCTQIGNITTNIGGHNPRTWNTKDMQHNDRARHIIDQASDRGANYLWIMPSKNKSSLSSIAFWCPDQC